MQEPTDIMQGIKWSCVTRDDTVLVKAGEDNFDGQVTRAAQELLKKGPTPGYEYYSPLRSPFKGIKFHVYELLSDRRFLIWSFCCVYDSTIAKVHQAQSFLENIVSRTRGYREEELWREGDELAAQEFFAEELLQQMVEVTYPRRAAMVQEHLDRLKEQMGRNIDAILERGEQLDDLQERTTQLEDMARVFRKKTKKLRRAQLWQQAKYGLAVGAAVTVGTAIVVAPIVVPLL